jgi:hypothetical protein
VADFENFVTLGSAQNKTSQTTISFTVGSTGAAADALLLVLIGSDNVETADSEDGSDISSVSDSKGNTYARAKTFTNGQGAVRAGVTVGIYYSKLTSELVTGDTVTVTFSEAVTAKVMSVARVQIDTGKDVAIAGTDVQADDEADPSEISISGLTSRDYLFVYAIARESNIPVSNDLDYSAFNSNQTSVGAANTNIALAGAARILTGTGDSVDLTAGTTDDFAQAYVAFSLEVPAGPSEPTSPLIFVCQGPPTKKFDLGVEE